jgi:sec-independent protein translocase protein TatA
VRMGMAELGIILAILVLLFGAKRLPQLADGMGKAIRNFKRGLNSDDEPDVTPPDKQVAETSSAKDLESAASDAKTADQKG